MMRQVAAGPRRLPADGPDRNQLFSKTKFCKFEFRGMCTRGSACCFAHTPEELRGLPDLRRTKLCAVLMQTGSCGNADCNFAHSREELRSTDKLYKAKRQEQRQRTAGGRARAGRPGSDEEPKEGEVGASLGASSGAGWAAGPAASMGLHGMAPGSGVPEWMTAGACAAPAPWLAGVSDLLATGALPHEPAYVPLRRPGFALGSFGSSFGDGLVIDQADDVWQVKPAALGEPQQLPIRTVRTSESTLCTLGDEQVYQA